MVKKFVTNTRLTSTLPSTAFTVQGQGIIQKRFLKASPTNQGITQRNTQNIRLNNRKVPLNPLTPNKPRSGNFATRLRVAGF